MKIAMMGSRGIPAGYGGFETLAEELSVRLVERGHDVTVYCRVPHVSFDGNTYRGVRLVKLPTVRRKHLDTIAHTGLSAAHALSQGYDIVLMFIAGNSPLSPIPRIVGQRVVLHVDGLDWRRAKWGGIARRYIQWCETLAPILPDAFITDSAVVAEYYRDRFGRAPDAVIGYGGDATRVPPGETLANLGLEPRRYLLFVGRLVPENCVHHLVEACRDLDGGFRCVIVGDALYQEEYVSYLKQIAGRSTLFTGYVFGKGYRELASNAFVFVEPSEVGGTHPAIVEAMAMGNCVVVNGIAENRETIGDAGLAYDGERGSSSLEAVLRQLVESPSLVESYRRLARDRARQRFQWELIVDEYEELFERIRGLRDDRAPAGANARPQLVQTAGGTVLRPLEAAVASQRKERAG
ncbi:MAG TPA: glycosyltransferase [Chloroflexota bacterium]|nr:glycosyltransferase [Chloroflexota bacterium]